mmetsp:Transcript_56050/g.130541  ORF Transcript_56050/g.130541 Transcript_56050/m.130541 type:complete len:143 (-) Transcript_56050:51-479(-)
MRLQQELGSSLMLQLQQELGKSLIALRHTLTQAPLGIFSALVQPPLVYIIIVLVLLCCMGGVVCVFKEQLQPYIHSTLDFLASVGRGCMAAGKFCYWSFMYVSYPVKESVISCIDAGDRCARPWRRRINRSDTPIPAFNVGV